MTSLGAWATGVGLLYLTTLSGCGEDDTLAASSVEDEIRLDGPTSEGMGFESLAEGRTGRALIESLIIASSCVRIGFNLITRRVRISSRSMCLKGGGWALLQVQDGQCGA